MRYRPTYSITLDPDVHDEAAAKVGKTKLRTFSRLVEHLLIQFLKRK